MFTRAWSMGCFCSCFVLNSNHCFQLCSVFRHTVHFHFDSNLSAEAVWPVSNQSYVPVPTQGTGSVSSTEPLYCKGIIEMVSGSFPK